MSLRSGQKYVFEQTMPALPSGNRRVGTALAGGDGHYAHGRTQVLMDLCSKLTDTHVRHYASPVCSLMQQQVVSSPLTTTAARCKVPASVGRCVLG